MDVEKNVTAGEETKAGNEGNSEEEVVESDNKDDDENSEVEEIEEESEGEEVEGEEESEDNDKDGEEGETMVSKILANETGAKIKNSYELTGLTNPVSRVSYTMDGKF